MKSLVEFTLDDGTTMLVETEIPTPEGGLVQASRPGDMLTKAHLSFGEAIDKVKPAAETIIKKLRNLHDNPDEIEVEFGIKLNAEAGAFLASAGVEANYTVTLKWKRSKEITRNDQ
jgi:hypothetical protein